MLIRFSETLGTAGANALLAGGWGAVLGLGGDDTLSSSTVYQPQLLVGGSGNDAYVAAATGDTYVLDAGGGNDRLVATNVGLTWGTTIVASIENRDLALVDIVTGAAVVLLDWRNAANRIETFTLGDATYTYEQVVAYGFDETDWYWYEISEASYGVTWNSVDVIEATEHYIAKSRYIEDPGSVELEGNNTAATATALVAGKTLNGDLRNEFDSDWFSLAVAAGSTVNIGFDRAGSQTAFQGYKWIAVYAPDGSQIAETYAKTLSFAAVAGGSYRIEIDGGNAYARVDYSLTATVTPGIAGLEREGNNTAATAMPLQLGVATKANIYQTDTDWYSVTVAEAGILTVSTPVSDLPYADRMSIALYDPNGQRVSVLYEPGSATTQIVVGPGTYKMAIEAPTGGIVNIANYIITASFTAGTEGFETEINDTMATADPLQLGATIRGAAGVHGVGNPGWVDYDWFAVQVTEAGVLTANLTGNGSMHFALVDAGGKVLAEISPDSGLRTLQTSAATAGTYYVQVLDGNYQGYSLNVTLSPGLAGWETENNDTLATADALVLGTTVRGSMGRGGDKDWFAVQVTSPGAVVVNFDGVEPGSQYGYQHSRVSLYAADGTLLASQFNSADFTLKANVAAAGTYYVRLDEGPLFNPMFSTPIVFPHSGYTLTVTSESSAPGREIEGNNTAATASLLAPAQAATGQLSSSTDVDWFAVSAASAGTLKFAFVSAENDPYLADDVYNGVYATLRILDASGNVLLTRQVEYRFPSTGASAIEVHVAAGGTYYAVLSGSGSTFVDNTYTLSVAVELDGIVGTAGNDTLSGTPGADVILGKDGNDTLRGLDGADALYGGTGIDFLLGGAGNDILDGGAEADILDGGDGFDIVRFGSVTGPVTIRVLSLSHWEAILPGGTVQNLYYFEMADAGSGLNGLGSVGDDQVNGGTGADSLAGGLGNDYLAGGSGDDTLTGGAGFDWLWAGPGGDSLDGGEEKDNINGEAGDDVIDAGAGNDRITGKDGNDTINAGEGNDWVGVWNDWGEDPARNYFPESGNDSISGDAGDDVLSAGLGTDTVDGGIGNDYVAGEQDNDSLTGGEGFDWLWAGAGADTLDGGAEKDNLNGESGNDLIFAGDGNDRICGQQGDDEIHAGNGNDWVGVWNDWGEDPALNYFPEGGNDLIFGDAGNDVLSAGFGRDTVHGGDDHDYVAGEQDDDQLFGNDGIDWLWGGSGNDSMDGGAGDDHLIGESGADLLTGGLGADIFEFRSISHAGHRILDFNAGQGDRIDVSELLSEQNYAGSDPFADGRLSRIQSGADVLFRFDGTLLATIENTTLAQLQTSFFIT